LINSNSSQHFEYRSEYGNSTLSVELPLNSTPSSSENSSQQSKEPVPKGIFSLVLGHRDCGFAAGAEIEASTHSYEIQALNAIGSYTASDLEVTVFSKTKFTPNATSTILGVSYIQDLVSRWKSLALGGELTYDGKAPSLSLGGTYKPDEASTVKTRINTSGLVGFSYTQRWGGPFAVTFSNDFNLISHTDPAQFGVKISLK